MYYLKFLVLSLTTTIPISFIAVCLGFLVAVLVNLLNVRNIKLLNWYIYVFQSIPPLVQLFLAYYGLSFIFSNQWITAIVILGLNFGAYTANALNGLYNGIGKEQLESARVEGATDMTAYRLVLLPQMLMTGKQTIVNNIIDTVKNTALMSTISIVDPFFLSQQMVSSGTASVFELYLSIALVYATLIMIINLIAKVL
jgi:polar amino acid transport system permease protein